MSFKTTWAPIILLWKGEIMNLKTQLTLIICSIIILFMASLGVAIYARSASIINKSSEEYMEAQLDRVQENIDLRVDINMLESREFSMDRKVQAFLEGEVSTRDMNDYLTGMIKEKNKRNNYYMDLFILNNKGHIISTCMPIAIDLDLHTREYFKESVKTKKTAMSDILTARSDDSLVVITVSPIFNDKGKVLGYAGISIYAEYFSDAISNLKLARTGYYAIIDSNNNILSHPVRSFIGKPSVFDINNREFYSDLAIKRNATGLNNQKEFQIFKHMTSRDWILVAALPQNDIHVQSRSLLSSVLIIGYAFLVLAIIIGTKVSRRISVPIVAMTEYMDTFLNGSSEVGKSLSESIGILKKSYKKDDEIIEENKYNEILRFSQTFSNLRNHLWQLLGYFERENESLVKTTEKMALTINEMYNSASGFLLTLSHELKNSITVIKGYAKGLKMGIIEDENLKNDFINSIYERTEELEEIIYDVLDSAYEAQTIVKTNKGLVDVEEFSAQILKDSRQFAEGSGLRLSEIIDLKPGKIYIDETKIIRVWNNLISNAVKYSQRGSTITVKILSENNMVRFEVEDEGMGIDEKEMDKIFNMFFRGENAGQKGYGLGLFICKSILDLHDSKLNVKSEEGQGSTFWFYINYFDC